MDIKQVRYKNARYLLKNQALGVTNFADKIGRSQSQTSAYIAERPTKNIGDKMARLIENAFDMPYGWLDERHKETELYNSVGEVKSVSANPFDEELFQQSITSNNSQRLVDASLELCKKIQKLRGDISALQKRKTQYVSELEQVFIIHGIFNLQAQGYSVVHVSEDIKIERSEFPFVSALSDIGYDVVLQAPDEKLVGIYFWAVALKQHRTPIPSFKPDIEHPGIESRLALYVVDGSELAFFYIPVTKLSGDKSVFTVEYNEVSGELKMDNFYINDLSITYLRDKVDLRLTDESRKAHLREVRARLEEKLKTMESQYEGDLKLYK